MRIKVKKLKRQPKKNHNQKSLFLFLAILAQIKAIKPIKITAPIDPSNNDKIIGIAKNPAIILKVANVPSFLGVVFIGEGVTGVIFSREGGGGCKPFHVLSRFWINLSKSSEGVAVGWIFS
jgi:hypothetical protein